MEISKLFHEYRKPKYGDNCKLLFTQDWYAIMAENIDLFDTTHFETSHLLYSLQNHLVLGEFKSETGSLDHSDFVGLRAKNV